MNKKMYKIDDIITLVTGVLCILAGLFCVYVAGGFLKLAFYGI
jgi:hypothetical protein